MKQYCKTQLNFSINGSLRQVCLPISIEYCIPEDEPVRLIDQILEEIDYTSLYRTYSYEGRKPAVTPKTLFKIMVYAYTKGIYSSREIERSCRMDLGFKYILEREKIPDHNTIARFRTKHLNQCIENLFSQLIAILAKRNEIKFEHLFVDGTKIEANANKYSFVWRKATEKFEAKLQIQAREFIEKELGITVAPGHISSAFMLRILKQLRNEIKRNRIVFVYGTGKRKTDLQKQYEILKGFSDRQKKYEEHESIFDGRNSFSKTDHDATFMHLKDDHMRNSQLKPAYNVQIGVESEYITGVMISNERSDVNTLIPFMEHMKKLHSVTYKNIIADAGYESQENYQYLENKGIKSFIKPSDYEYSKTRKFQRDMEFRLAMNYDDETDTYTCKNGKKLRYSDNSYSRTRTGYLRTSKVYKCETCDDCPYLGKCYKGKYAKTIYVNEVFDNYRKKSRENIVSDEGIILRVNRSIQAEGVFGITKQDMNFRRFMTRGTINVSVEYMLLAFGFNLNKLYSRAVNGRLGQALFIPDNLTKSA